MKFKLGDIEVRKLRHNDAPSLAQFRSDPRVYEMFLGHGRAVSVSDMERWVRDVNKREGDLVRAIATTDGRCIGFCGLYKIDQVDQRAELGVGIDPDYWGQGIAGTVTAHLVEYAFEALDLRRLTSFVRADNEPVRAYRLKQGFTHEGRLRRHIRRAENEVDVDVFGLLGSEWDGIPARYLSPVCLDGGSGL